MENTSRVVVLRARDAVALRAKVTVKFEEPQTQAIADQVLEACQDIVRAVVREAPSGASVLGFDAAIAAEVFGRLSPEPAAVRSVEIAGLHIVGDPGHLAQPTAGPESNPAWLHAPPTPASSDRPGEHTHDRPTPVHGFAALKVPGDRGLDRPTPVHGFPPFKMQPDRGLDRPTPTNVAPTPRTPTLDPAQKPVANEPPAKAPAREVTPIEAPPQRPRDPFAATAQSAQPVLKPGGAPSPAAQPAPIAQPSPKLAHAATAPIEAPRTPPHEGERPADRSAIAPPSPPEAPHATRAQPQIAHAPTMPAIAAQAPPRAPQAASRVVLGSDAAPPTTTSPETAPATPIAPPVRSPIAAAPPPSPAPAIAAAAPASPNAPPPGPAAGAAHAGSTAARSPAEKPLAASPGAYFGLGAGDPTPAPGAVRPRDPLGGGTRPDPNAVRGRSGSTFPPPANKGPGYPPFAASNAMRPPPGPRRTSSSGQLAAVSPDDPRLAALGASALAGRPSRTPDEPSASSRSYSLSGPPSTGRGSRTPDEPSASSRSYAHLAAQSAGGRNGPASRASNRPPPAAVAARRRVVASRLLLPMGAGPYEVARGLTPLLRDTAGRILVAFLRTYDLTVIRRVPFDAVESDILSSLTAPSDGAPGTYTASHATEIHRWREAFGNTKLDRLQREANLAAAALAHEMFTAEAVPSSMTAAVVEGLAGSAFGDPDMLLDIGRYLYPARETTSAEALANMIELAGEEMPPGLEAALDPLFASLREEVAAVAEIAKEVMLTPG